MSFSFMVRTSLIYFCWVGEPQLQIYQGVFILSIAKAFFPLAEPVVVLRTQQHGDMMYTAVLYLFYLPKQEPYFILKAHQVKKQHRTLFQQQYFSSPFFDLCKISTLQPQTLQPDRSAALWECMWIIAHKKNCI